MALRKTAKTRLSLERLEDRSVPSASFAGIAMQTVNTVPPNGDVNPYGVAFVPSGFPGGGPLHAGDILVSNFNDSNNLQGTGTTIVNITPNDQTSVFFQGQTGLGLTTALGVLKRGYVVVGNTPSTDGTANTVQPGSILVLDRFGDVLLNIANPFVNGPWDMAVNDQGAQAQLFVSNVLSGTVIRIDLAASAAGNSVAIESITTIASGYGHRSDPAAFELGPTGLVYNAKTNALFVASTLDNEIFMVPNAGTTQKNNGTGQVIYQDNTHLHGPLGLAVLPSGNFITADGDAVNPPPPNQLNELVEFTPSGHFVLQFSVDTTADGGAFGLAVGQSGGKTELAAVDDVDNMLEIFSLSGNAALSTASQARGSATLTHVENGSTIEGQRALVHSTDDTDSAISSGSHADLDLSRAFLSRDRILSAIDALFDPFGR